MMAMMTAEVGDNMAINYKDSGTYDTRINTCLRYWDDFYYPKVIQESYPVYIQERAEDKGKKAFELIKILKDKKLLQIKTVEDFIEAMTTLINIL